METSALSVFITGGTNFVGRAVTRFLVAEGHAVTAMTVGTAGGNMVREDGGLPVYADPYRAGEIRSVLHMAQADVVLNLAPQAYNHIPNIKAKWDERVLTDGTETILEAAQAAGVKFFIHASYAFLYGDTGGEWVDESAPLRVPDDNLIFEAAVQAEKLVQASDMPSCILRVGYAYGPSSKALSELSSSLGRSVILGRDQAYSNWIHTDDLASALLLAADHQGTDEIFNIVDDEPATPVEFVNFFAESMGLPHPGRALPLLARPTKEQLILLDTSVKVKNEKAKEKLDWAPKYPSYRQGIEHTLLNWRAGEPALT